MFWSTFNKLQLSPDLLRPYTGCLYGFVGDQVKVCGYLELRTTFTDGTTSRTESIRYLVVNVTSYTPMEVEPMEQAMPIEATPVEAIPAEETPREAAPLEEAHGEASPMEEVFD